MNRRVLVVAPHPDDEVLGVGGTMARLSGEGNEVHVAVVTKGFAPEFDESLVSTVRAEAQAAHLILGVKKTHFLDFPAAGLDSVPHRELNAGLSRVVEQLAPQTMFVPFSGDLHVDHQLVAHACLVAARPVGMASVREVLAYETVSETNWNSSAGYAFVPNLFMGLSSAMLELKLDALACFASQIRDFPHERSLEAVRALATTRGSTVGFGAAEAFVLIRSIRDDPGSKNAIRE